MATPSALLVWAFALIGIVVGALFPIGLRHAMRRLEMPPPAIRRSTMLAVAGTVLWMGATLAAAASGRLSFDSFPPPIALVMLLMLIGAFGLGLSRVGERLALGLPLVVLVGAQSFRLPLELAMHRAYEEGVMPVQLSYSGYNFDIFTGIGAIVAATLLWMGLMPRWGVWLWNGVGSALLLNVVTIAWLSTPTPMRVFMNEPANVWISEAPFIWLPSVMVFAAFLGHIVVFRRLFAEARGGVAVGAPISRPASEPSEPARV